MSRSSWASIGRRVRTLHAKRRTVDEDSGKPWGIPFASATVLSKSQVSVPRDAPAQGHRSMFRTVSGMPMLRRGHGSWGRRTAAETQKAYQSVMNTPSPANPSPLRRMPLLELISVPMADQPRVSVLMPKNGGKSSSFAFAPRHNYGIELTPAWSIVFICTPRTLTSLYTCLTAAALVEDARVGCAGSPLDGLRLLAAPCRVLPL